MKNKFSVKLVVEGGIMIALAFVLGKFKLFSMPQGGSVTAGSMIPLLIFALRHGTVPGILVGVVYGLLDSIGGYIVGPIQYLLDYPIAYGALGLAGIFSKEFMTKKSLSPILWGTLLGGFGRFICHVLSGVIFFSEYAGEANPWIYSMSYNGTFIFVELIIAIILIFLLKTFILTNLSNERIG